jgi:flagellar basal body-associated protein FliL
MKKLPILAVALLAVIGGVYKFVLAKPAKPAPKPHVDSLVYVLPKDFIVYLKHGRYARVSIGLEISKKHPESLTPNTGESAATTPKGYGVMPEEAVVREVVTGDLTGLSPAEFLGSAERKALKARLAKDLTAQTDVKVDGVLFSDLAIQ